MMFGVLNYHDQNGRVEHLSSNTMVLHHNSMLELDKVKYYIFNLYEFPLYVNLIKLTLIFTNSIN